MNIYDEHYLIMDCIRGNIKELIESMQNENPRDKRIICLLQAEEYIKRAMMKGSIYK